MKLHFKDGTVGGLKLCVELNVKLIHEMMTGSKTARRFGYFTGLLHFSIKKLQKNSYNPFEKSYML